jgi:polyhydroxyalkanoate synthesis regulator phasin
MSKKFTSQTGNTLDSLKKAFLIGLGATVTTAEKIKDWADELVAKGELTPKEAKAFTDELRDRVKKEKTQIEAKTREAIDIYSKKLMDSLGLVTRDEFETLKKKVAGKTTATQAPKKTSKTTTKKVTAQKATKAITPKKAKTDTKKAKPASKAASKASSKTAKKAANTKVTTMKAKKATTAQKKKVAKK